MAKQEWKENKGRRPYAADVRVDVQLRVDAGASTVTTSLDRRAGGLDWSITDVRGDILFYRKSEEQ